MANPNGRHSEVDPQALAAVLGDCARGDEAAWRRIVEWYGRRVLALARSRCRSREVAEEITQSVFATLAAKVSRGEYVEQGRFEAWLFRIAMNRVRDEARRRRRQAPPTDPETLGERAVGTERGAFSDADLGALRDAVLALSQADQEVIQLRHHAGMSFQGMADLLDEPIGTLLARHHRALRKLKELLKARGVSMDGEDAGGTGLDRKVSA